MSQEKQFCRNCGKRDSVFSQESTVHFWEPGLCSECHHLPIISTRYDVFTGGHIQPQIIWQIDVPPDTSVSIDTNAQDVVTRNEPTSTHDGKLDEKGTYEVLYHIERPNGSFATCIALEDACGNFRAHLTPKQALSLLAWLRDNEATLEQLAKEQAE